MSPSPISKTNSSHSSSTGWGTPNFNSSEDFPMSSEMHSEPYSTSPKLINPIFYPNDPSTASPFYIHSNYLSSQSSSNSSITSFNQDFYNPKAPPLMAVDSATSNNPDLYNPLLSIPMSTSLTDESTASNVQDLYNPLLIPQMLSPSSAMSTDSGNSNIFNPLLPQMASTPSNSSPKTLECSSITNADLYNPLLNTQASCSTSLPYGSQPRSSQNNPDLCNPLLPASVSPCGSSGSALDNRRPLCDQVAGHSRPVAPSDCHQVDSACLHYDGSGFEIGGSPAEAMSRPGASPPDVQRSADVTPDDPQQLYAMLNEYLLLENKFQPRLCLPAESDKLEVTLGARSGAAHVLRWLAVWFDLPPSVFFHAISLLDRFLTKMRVRPCHVACITVSCMKVALERDQHAPPVTAKQLVSVSQSACTAGDVTRMSGVICDKLEVAGPSVTALHWLRLLRAIVVCAAAELGLPPVCQEEVLVKQLEIVVCDAACANARISELALVLVFHNIEQQMVEWSASGLMTDSAYYLYELGAQLQQHCRMTDESLSCTRALVRGALSRYEASTRNPHRQRFVWRLSTRTLKVLRPTERLTSVLPTIEEQHHNDASPRTPTRNRSGSESSENEETSDWPRSPVLPVYCDN